MKTPASAPVSTRVTRRQALRAGAAFVAAPAFVPSRLLGADAPSNRIAVAVIGCGGKAHGGARNLVKFGRCEIVALADPNRLNLDRYARDFGVPPDRCAQDFRATLTRDDIDAVLVGTPDHWHVPISIAAARAGKHVYCEKPLSNSIREGQALVEAVRKAGVVFQHGTQLRSLATTRRACELVRHGHFGQVRKVVIGSPPGHAIGALPPEPVPETLDWDLWVGPAQPLEYRPAIVGDFPGGRGLRGWYFIKRFSLAGWIAGYGVHDLDLAHWGLGLEQTGPVRIEGRGDFPRSGLFDTVLGYELTFTYADGRQVVMTDTGQNRHGVTFMYENGRDWVYTRYTIDASDKRLLEIPLSSSDERLYVSPNHEQNFADCIRQGTAETITPVDVAHRSTSVCLLGGICLDLGRPLQWDPVAERFVGDDEANARLACQHRPPWNI
jgi:predicted dehydrogenase